MSQIVGAILKLIPSIHIQAAHSEGRREGGLWFCFFSWPRLPMPAVDSQGTPNGTGDLVPGNNYYYPQLGRGLRFRHRCHRGRVIAGFGSAVVGGMGWVMGGVGGLAEGVGWLTD